MHWFTLVFFSLCIQLQTRQCDLQLLPRLHMALARTRGPPPPNHGALLFWNLLKNGSDFSVWSIITRRWLLTDCYRLYRCDSGNWRYKLLEVEGDVGDKDRIYLNENCQRSGNFKRAGSEKVWWLVTFEYYTSCSTLARFKKHFAYFKTWTGIARKVNFQQKRDNFPF